MQETIDLIAHGQLRNLKRFTRETGQPTKLAELDLEPMKYVQSIEIDEEHVTVKYNQQTERYYNVNRMTTTEWVYKYNDNPEFVAAIRAVIELSRKHMYDLPDNLQCPPGCAECCSGYEPFVSREDVQRLADHLGLTYDDVFNTYVVHRESADGHYVGWLRKVDAEGELSEEQEHKCVFLMGGRSGKHYCGVYEGRPGDCRAFTPIGCGDVDWSLPRHGGYKTGDPFRPKRRHFASAQSRNGKTSANGKTTR